MTSGQLKLKTLNDNPYYIGLVPEIASFVAGLEEVELLGEGGIRSWFKFRG